MPHDFGALSSEVANRVVEVNTTDGGTDTGFFVAPSFSVVTARHVVELYQSDTLHSTVSVYLRDGQVVSYTVRQDIEAKDLVVLEPSRPLQCSELQIASRAPRPGETVILVGLGHYFTGDPLETAVVPGNVIVVGASGGAADFLMHAYTAFGGSGSPVLNTEGLVVGMAGGREATTLEDEGEFIHDSNLVWGVDVTKHLR